MLVYGGLVSTFMTDSAPPHVIQAAISTLVNGVMHVFGVGGPPPVITA